MKVLPNIHLDTIKKKAIYTLHSIYRRAIIICDSSDETVKNLLRQKEYLHIAPLLNKVRNESNKKLHL